MSSLIPDDHQFAAHEQSVTSRSILKEVSERLTYNLQQTFFVKQSLLSKARTHRKQKISGTYQWFQYYFLKDLLPLSDLIEYTLGSQDLNTPSQYLKRYTTPVDITLESGKAT